MRALTDSRAHAEDPETLRARLGVDGYLFLRGLLPRARVEAAGAAVHAALAAGGWADGAGRPTGATRAVNALDAAGDPAYRRAAGAAEFNRIPYLSPLRNLVRGLLGAEAFSYPVKVLRAVYPEGAKPPRGRYIHQDYIGAAVNDMLTSWVPLMPIPIRLGGLAVLPGSHLGAPPPLRVLSEGQAEREGWATADYAPGDVLLFHCLTSHAALPNRADRLRVSQDSRWQAAGQPAPARLVYGPKQPEQGELFSRLFGRHRWWEPIPPGQPIARPGTSADAAPWSRFFPVDPRWAGRADRNALTDVR
jgi:hypothetical protein